MNQKSLASGQTVGKWVGTSPNFWGVNHQDELLFLQNEDQFLRDMYPSWRETSARWSLRDNSIARYSFIDDSMCPSWCEPSARWSLRDNSIARYSFIDDSMYPSWREPSARWSLRNNSKVIVPDDAVAVLQTDILEAFKFEDSTIHIDAVLAANDVECDDLGAIDPDDAVDLSNHIEELIVSGIPYHLMNNKEPEYRNGKLLISSDSLCRGLSIFQELKGAGIMRLETNSESQKVRLSSKGRNCRLKPTSVLLCNLLGNFLSVSSRPVPPATNSNAASVDFTGNQVGAPLAASTPSSLSGARLIALIAGIVLFAVIGVGICCFSCGKGRMRTEIQLSTTMSPSSDNGLSECNFTYQDLAMATDDFSHARLLGQGGFGFVYKGVLPTGEEIAVKQLKSTSSQGEREFQAEVETIGCVHHRHLVPLVGYCVQGDQRFLVYEFVSNGTMEFHLHGDGGPPMSLEARSKIAMGTAKGLAYLHEDCKPKIIHRDLKSSNILIDDSFEAKVADFGLAKLFGDNCTHVSTRVMGTFGYLDPDYAFTGKLTEKSDVFSFGVLLLELITGRRPIDRAASSSDVSMLKWARPLLIPALNSGIYDHLVDPNMTGYKASEMARMIACAAVCLRKSAKQRPQMSQVVRALEGYLSVPTILALGRG